MKNLLQIVHSSRNLKKKILYITIISQVKHVHSIIPKNEEIQQILDEDEYHNKRDTTVFKYNKSRQKLEIFIDALDITINSLLLIYLIYSVHLSNGDWLINLILEEERESKKDRNLKFIRNHYNNLNIIIMMLAIYLIIHILFFVYELDDLYFCLKISTYITIAFTLLGMILAMYNGKDMNKEIKGDLNYKGGFVFSIAIANFLLLFGKTYMRDKRIKNYNNSPNNQMYL